MSNLYEALKKDKSFVRSILVHALDYEGWSLQGFGMLRLYLTKDIRLHVWDSRFAVPNVSLIHTHPWDFSSFIVAGQIRNRRYEADARFGFPFSVSKIQCGPGGGIRSDPAQTYLTCHVDETLYEGSEYSQTAEEIHESTPLDGTVTIIERTFKPDTEHAEVFWPSHKIWVSAEPRPATESEVESICHRALACWFF